MSGTNKQVLSESTMKSASESSLTASLMNANTEAAKKYSNKKQPKKK